MHLLFFLNIVTQQLLQKLYNVNTFRLGVLTIFLFSSIRVPKGLEDVSKYPYLFAEMVKRNWTEEELGKIAGLNLIRVLKRTEEVGTFELFSF